MGDRPQGRRPGPPPAYGSPQFIAEAHEVLETTRKLTEDQKRIATYWAGGAGTPLPPGIWNQILLDTVREERFSTPRIAGDFALLNVAQADAGSAAWDYKSIVIWCEITRKAYAAAPIER